MRLRRRRTTTPAETRPKPASAQQGALPAGPGVAEHATSPLCGTSFAPEGSEALLVPFGVSATVTLLEGLVEVQVASQAAPFTVPTISLTPAFI